MPIVTMPDGLNVKFPDEMSKEDISKAIQKRYPDAFKAQDTKPDMSTGDTAADTLIGAGSGVTKGAVNTLELPADIASGARWLADKAGVPQGTINMAAKATKATPFVGDLLKASQAVRNEMDNPTTAVGKAVSGYTGYKPESTLGKYAKTTGEFAINAVGPKAGLIERAGKYVVAPALASETLGQLSEGTPAEPYLRAAGGLLGMGFGAGALNPIGELRATKALASAEDFTKSGHTAYEDAKQANVILKNNTVDNLKTGLSQHLDDIGFLPGSETKASAVLDNIYKNLETTNSRVLAGRGAQTGFGQKPLALWELDKVSSKIADKIKDLSPTDRGDRRILWAAKHYIDEFGQGLGKNDIMAGDLPKGLKALAEAKNNWKTKSKLELVDQIEKQSKDTGQAVYTRGGKEHATRREFLKFLRKDPNKRQRLTADEELAFRKVAGGTLPRNALRALGKLGNSPASALYSGTAAGLAGSLISGPFAAIAGIGTPLAGAAARLLSNRATQNAVNDARSIIINGGKGLYRPHKSILDTLLTLNAIRNQ